VARVWAVVLVANMAGASGFGIALFLTGDMQGDVYSAIIDISHHAVHRPPGEILWRGVGAGWLIAALVWIMASSDRSKLPLVVIVTYVIALAGFSHVVAGTTEAAVLVAEREIGAGAAVFEFALPALIGNILGGSVLFTLLTWAQIRAELADRKRAKSGERERAWAEGRAR